MTDREVELAALASLGGWFKRRREHAGPPDGACSNCGAVLQGPYCHQCGQHSADFHRSIGHLAEEAVEDLFHLDGRLLRTLPRLVLKPGKLTRDYLDGHRASQIPPLRMFLVVLVLVFLLGGLGHEGPVKAAARPGNQSWHVAIDPKGYHPPTGNDVNIDLGPKPENKAQASWLKTRILAAAKNPEQFGMVLESWAHRLAVLMLPVGAGLLALLFAFKRRFYIYDHLIFTMHSLSFQGLLLSGYFLIALVSDSLAGLLILAAPVHLFAHMRGVYRTSVPGTLLRMVLLFIGSFVAFVFLLALLMWIGLNAMGQS